MILEKLLDTVERIEKDILEIKLNRETAKDLEIKELRSALKEAGSSICSYVKFFKDYGHTIKYEPTILMNQRSISLKEMGELTVGTVEKALKYGKE